MCVYGLEVKVHCFCYSSDSANQKGAEVKDATPPIQPIRKGRTGRTEKQTDRGRYIQLLNYIIDKVYIKNIYNKYRSIKKLQPIKKILIFTTFKNVIYKSTFEI